MNNMSTHLSYFPYYDGDKQRLAYTLDIILWDNLGHTFPFPIINPDMNLYFDDNI